MTMRKTLIQVLVFTFTFTFGSSVVWNMRGPSKAPVPVEPVFVYEPFGHTKHRFSPTARGCGPGYVQFYETDDGQHVTEGASPISKSFKPGYREQIRKAKQIISRTPNYRNSAGEVGERVVLVNKSSEMRAESVSILWYAGRDFYRFITAPTLDLALEFEKFVIETNYRAF
jgi:hypothetical protein